MFKKRIIKDGKSWNKIIENFSIKDIYFTYDYFVPFRNNGDGEPALYYLECEYGKVAYPFMLRDISSAYGYGGPLYESYKEDETVVKLREIFFKSFSDYCNEKNIGSYVGGTCNETNRSAEVTTNIAIACGADQILAKPGMGFDEGYMIVKNEMNRVLKLVEYRKRINRG